MPWPWKRKDAGASSRASVTTQLRAQALGLDPQSVGFEPTADLPRVFGAVMDTAYPNGLATLVVLVDGTASLYVSTGSGIIGGGGHEAVVAEGRRFLAALEAQLDELSESTSTDPPHPGRVVIHALTYAGRRSIEAVEEDLGLNRHALSPVFYAAHRVITALRLIEEGQAG